MLKRSNKLMAPLSLLVIAAVMLAACTPATATTQAPPPTAVPPTAVPPTAVPPTAVPPTEEPTSAPVVELKIAFLGPLTGGAAFLGTEQLAFARLAVEDFNEANDGHYNATLLEEDTDITPDKATPVCQKDADDDTVLAIVGPAGSGQVEACAQILEDAGLVHVSPSATRPSLAQQGNKTFFRVVPNDDVQGPTDGNYIADVIGAKTVYVLDDQESYGTNLADTVQKTLEDKGVTVERASVTQADTDFSALVTKIAQGALMARQLKEQGVDIPVFGGDGFFSSKEYIDDAGGATEGSYASVFAPDIHGVAEAADVIAAADAAFPTWGSFGPPTYVATMVVLEAAVRASEAGHLDRATVLAEVAKTDMASTILGIPVKFDATGEVLGAAFFISQVTDGKFVQVYP
ncbi:MAG: Peripla BP 6 protein [Anaerolineales bacterium]|nr:Peripla BP 6 protein [Anaerolineales bacterium]